MTIAVTGATGRLGRLVVQRLASRRPAGNIVALVRSPEKGADLGVATRAFDYARPETLAGALAGVETLLLISSSEVGQRAIQHRNVIAAAARANVGRIVYTSLLRADVSPIGIADEHRATEAELLASGVAHTILRHGWYTENYTAWVPRALASGVLVGSAGDGRISSAARADFAEAAVAVLTGEGHAGKVYELGGDEAYTLTELAAEISRQSGREVRYRNVPEAEYAALLSAGGMPEARARSLASSDALAARGALFEGGRQLSRLIGRPTSPMSAAVAAALG